MKIGDFRIYQSHSGKRWILQRRTTAVGLIAALHGGGEMWEYAGHTFRNKEEGIAFLGKIGETCCMPKQRR